jgi:hypothetical protein
METKDVLSFSELMAIEETAEIQVEESIEIQVDAPAKSDVLSFLEFLEEDLKGNLETRTQLKEIVVETEKEVESLALTRDDKVIEALKRTNIQSRINLMDPEYLKEAHERYLVEINSDEYKRRRRREEPTLVGIKKVISQVIARYSSQLGSIIIGKSKIT